MLCDSQASMLTVAQCSILDFELTSLLGGQGAKIAAVVVVGWVSKEDGMASTCTNYVTVE